jgi:hypothetical protein
MRGIAWLLQVRPRAYISATMVAWRGWCGASRESAKAPFPRYGLKLPVGRIEDVAGLNVGMQSLAGPRGYRRQILADGRTQGGHLLCRIRPSTAPHEATHRNSIPNARIAVQSLGVHYSSPPEVYTVVCRSAAGLFRQVIVRVVGVGAVSFAFGDCGRRGCGLAPASSVGKRLR